MQAIEGVSYLEIDLHIDAGGTPRCGSWGRSALATHHGLAVFLFGLSWQRYWVPGGANRNLKDQIIRMALLPTSDPSLMLEELLYHGWLDLDGLSWHLSRCCPSAPLIAAVLE